MRTSLLAIALAAATLPLTFAQTTPAAPADNPPAKSTVKKVHKKHHVKKAVKTTGATTSTTPAKELFQYAEHEKPLPLEKSGGAFAV